MHLLEVNRRALNLDSDAVEMGGLEHPFEVALPLDFNMLVMDLEVEHAQSDLVFPGGKDSLSSLPVEPGLRILGEEPPSLQNIDQVEPLFVNLSLSKQIHLVKYLELEISIFNLALDLFLPADIDLLLFEFLKMLGAG